MVVVEAKVVLEVQANPTSVSGAESVTLSGFGNLPVDFFSFDPPAWIRSIKHDFKTKLP